MGTTPLVTRLAQYTCAILDVVVFDGNDDIVEVEDDVLVCRCGGKR